MKVLTSVKAQNNFGELLDTVQREPVAITRHGRPAAYIISPHEMEELQHSRRLRREAIAEFKEWMTKTADRVKPAAASLTMEDINRLVHETR